MKTHWSKKFNSPNVINPRRNTFLLPSFTLAPSTWSGASLLLSLYSFGNTDYSFSLKLPIVAFGENFVAAVRWVSNGIVYRYKLWDDGVLYFPVYNGERIGLNAVLEIWSVETTEAPDLLDNYIFYSSVFTFPPNCCPCLAEFGNEILLTLLPTPDPIPPDTFCNPFCENLQTLCNT